MRCTKLITLIFCLLAALSVQATEQPKYLVLHSYHASFEWTKEIQRGIEDAAKLLPSPPTLSVEYLDTKRIYSPSYMATVGDFLKTKYQDYRFDGVIISDDNGLKLFNTLDKELFGNLPVVAVGINEPDATLRPMTPRGVVIPELSNVPDTIALIHQAQKKIKNLYFVSDNSFTSNQIRPHVYEAVQNYPDTQLIEIRDQPLPELVETLQQASPEDAVLLVLYNPEVDKGIYYSQKELSTAIGPTSQAPIFVTSGGYIQSGIVGGLIINTHSFGVQAMQTLSLLTQNATPNLRLEANYWTPIFDYDALLKFGYKPSDLVKDAILINKPEPLLSEYMRLLLLSLSVVMTLLVIIVMQFLSSRRKKQASSD